ncbi:hypothetical protein HMPREF9372_3509 [Sporosarcina newyorkensis 2681]|uniref:Uncharacterized protein n=1 Tax=Sporosarcina newyorkensis 2681 TaxID=1027292 RepID=F9DXH8_9BACL|nr:hypothetical protein HMPREF9372_3509 [Sporosarcina newyorkensis 2681]
MNKTAHITASSSLDLLCHFQFNLIISKTSDEKRPYLQNNPYGAVRKVHE